jgi:hypothetical protein
VLSLFQPQKMSWEVEETLFRCLSMEIVIGLIPLLLATLLQKLAPQRCLLLSLPLLLTQPVTELRVALFIYTL